MNNTTTTNTVPTYYWTDMADMTMNGKYFQFQTELRVQAVPGVMDEDDEVLFTVVCYSPDMTGWEVYEDGPTIAQFDELDQAKNFVQQVMFKA